MAFIRSVAVVVMCAVATTSGSTVSIAQTLSKAALSISVAWPQGYMGLGGHLSQAIAKPARVKAPPARQRPRVQKTRTAPTLAPGPVPTVAHRRDVTPLYLVSMSLDPTGLNIAALR